MPKQTIFKELIKRGYSIKHGKKVWDISDSKLWYLTPELSEGFLALAKYEPYRIKVIDTELDLIRNNKEKFAELFHEDKINLIDLGCGDGTKACEFIKSLPKDTQIKYSALDISEYFLDKAKRKIEEIGEEKIKKIKTFKSDFGNLGEVIKEMKNGSFQKDLILLLGETISHYEVNELLFKISDQMDKGDCIIIGNGYKVGERFVELEKYKDSLFDKWFFQILKNIGFEQSEVKYDARFKKTRLEFFYSVEKDKEIIHDGKRIIFNKGDEIVIANQYKYYEKEWKEFLSLYFSDIEIIKDEKKEYAFWICSK